MSYCGLDLIRALGTSKTSVQVILVTPVARTEVWVQDGQIVQFGGCSLDELLERLIETDPVVTMHPVAPLAADSNTSKISVLSLELPGSMIREGTGWDKRLNRLNHWGLPFPVKSNSFVPNPRPL